jgi:hypothetical protein
MRKLIAILWTLTIACHHVDPTPELTCGEDGDTLEFTLTETERVGDCAEYAFPGYPEVFTFPLPQLSGCSPQVQAVACELDGSQTCDYGGGLDFTTNWTGVELVSGGTGAATATVEGSAGLVCFLAYDVSIEEL